MKQRAFLLALAVLVAALLSACTPSLANNSGSSQPTIALHTPAANLTPTPTAPPQTIVAFASNQSPKVNDSITIYVIFHISVNGGPPRGVGGASVSLDFTFYSGAPVSQLNSQGGTQQTTQDGWAAFPISFTGLQAQTPILVEVTVSYHGKTYQQPRAAFFTPLAGSPTPTPKPGGGGGGGNN
ncbi:MAG TPA: hypothetical protein VH599_08875 [Ktedonobacterales bacterium]|jgi:hypothetical protein